MPISALPAEPIMLDALRLSVGTLTIVPSGAIAEIDRRTAARAMIIAPLAVLPLAVGRGRWWAGWPEPPGCLLWRSACW